MEAWIQAHPIAAACVAFTVVIVVAAAGFVGLWFSGTYDKEMN
ncbi:MAG: hypothetical protein ACM3TU_02730 [Bacillota bacterium]